MNRNYVLLTTDKYEEDGIPPLAKGKLQRFSTSTYPLFNPTDVLGRMTGNRAYSVEEGDFEERYPTSRERAYDAILEAKAAMEAEI